MMKNLAYGLGIFLVAILLYMGLITNAEKGNPQGVKEGSPAPDFELETLDGKKIRLSDLKGKVVLINFWATWCPPCRREMPLFERVYRENKHRGFVILAISTDSEETTVKKFVEEYNLSFPIMMDTAQVSSLYGIQGLPTSFLIGRDGKIVKIRLGEYKEVERDVKDLL